jgi:PAS domain S-box-containing protein
MNTTPNFWTTFTPHGDSYLWRADVLWLNVISDGFIGAAYLSIPICLFLAMRNRPATPFRPMTIMFAAFIFCCGITHLLSIWTVWYGDYGLLGISKGLTAVLSVATAVSLIPAFPKLVTSKTPIELKAFNTELKGEIQRQKDISKKLQRTETQFRAFLQQAPDGIFICTENGKIEYSNFMLQNMFGYSSNELVGKYIYKFLPSRSHDKIGLDHNHLFDEKEARSLFSGAELTVMRHDGTEFFAEIRMSPITSGGEEFLLVTLRDISDRKAREEDARKDLAELAHESRMSSVGHMATGLAHELNQPLTAISTNLHTAMLIYSKSEQQDPELLEIMRENYHVAQHAGEIIRSLRQLVRKENVVKNETDINALVSTTATLLEPEAQAAGVELKLNLDTQLLAASVNPVQIQQVIVNLGRNAIEDLLNIQNGSPLVSISTKQQTSDSILITVKDNGHGISKEIEASLFLPHISSKEAGMGLGLSISQSIIESIGGKLWYHGENNSGADSGKNRGSTFCFTIPTPLSGAD